MDDYYDVKIKRVNKYKYKVRIDFRSDGWNNRDCVGSIVFAKHIGEWWFVPEKHEVLGAKELQIIADKINELTEAQK